MIPCRFHSIRSYENRLKRFLDCLQTKIIIPYLQFIWNAVYKKQLFLKKASFSVYLCYKIQLSSSFCIKKLGKTTIRIWRRIMSLNSANLNPLYSKMFSAKLYPCWLNGSGEDVKNLNSLETGEQTDSRGKFPVCSLCLAKVKYSETCLNWHICNPFPCVIWHWFSFPYDRLSMFFALFNLADTLSILTQSYTPRESIDFFFNIHDQTSVSTCG